MQTGGSGSGAFTIAIGASGFKLSLIGGKGGGATVILEALSLETDDVGFGMTTTGVGGGREGTMISSSFISSMIL